MTLKINDTVFTDELIVKCDGGGKPLGHPLIYLHLNKLGKVTCPYCSKEFQQEQQTKKRKMKMKTISYAQILLVGVALTLTACGEDKKTKLANPASQNCIDKGGTLKIEKRGDGGEYGICYFMDNRQCEEWALYRGECPEGGIKVTGYNTPEATYCAITGGQVSNDQTECKLPSGITCSVKDLYNGTCR